MADLESFKLCTGLLSERLLNERYDLELVLRFLSLRRVKDISGFTIQDVGDFLDSQIDSLYPNFDDWKDEETKILTKTFELLAEKVGQDVFRRYLDGKYKGPFLISGFEAIAVGVGRCVEKYDPKKTHLDIKTVSQTLWSHPEFVKFSGVGVKAHTRVPKMLEIGCNLFEHR